jgi:hypothetical protein
MREYFEKFHSNRLENLEEMNKFLDAFDPLILNQEPVYHSNKTITNNEIESLIKSPKNEKPRI